MGALTSAPWRQAHWQAEIKFGIVHDAPWRGITQQIIIHPAVLWDIVE